MKCYRIFLVGLRLTLQLHQIEPIFFCYTAMIIYFISPTSNNLSHIQHLLLSWDLSSISAHISKALLKCFFLYPAIKILFQSYFFKHVSCIFTPIKNNWLAKFIININNLISRPARNIVFLFFSAWSISPYIQSQHKF